MILFIPGRSPPLSKGHYWGFLPLPSPWFQEAISNLKWLPGLLEKIAISSRGLPRDTFLNINVPNLDEKRSSLIRSVRRWIHDGITLKMIPEEKILLDRGGQLIFDKGRNTDMEAVSKSHISITPLNLDLTNYASIQKLRKWRL
jgi:broad specificity polyphosphatase/5'/3'-nucleotidase SurE